jgi:uncharacterized membrane protein YkvA (DUF1232 family)
MDLIPDWIPIIGILDDTIAQLVMVGGVLLIFSSVIVQLG